MAQELVRAKAEEIADAEFEELKEDAWEDEIIVRPEIKTSKWMKDGDPLRLVIDGEYIGWEITYIGIEKFNALMDYTI